jgi:nitronate monooxygenase
MPQALQTPLCELLGIRYPILLAGMAGGPTTPELVAAVSEAGGLGTFGAHGMSAERLADAIRRTRELTSRPIGVNVLLATRQEPRDSPEAVRAALTPIRNEMGLATPIDAGRSPAATALELIDVAIDAGVEVLSTGLGDPAPVVERARSAGRPVIAMVASVADAEVAAASGADALVAQGSEAGGHRSNFTVPDTGLPPLVGSAALIPQVAAAVPVPVIAAGGFMDGAGLVAALALGAQGVQYGTRFLATAESGANPAYQRRLSLARDTDSEIITAFSGRPARGLRNRVLDALEAAGSPSVGYPRQASEWADIRAAADRIGSENTALWAGQAAGRVTPGMPAADVVAAIVQEAEETIARLAGG